MYNSGEGQRPNVRTLNTLLRACLWNAATFYRYGDVYDDEALLSSMIHPDATTLTRRKKKAKKNDSSPTSTTTSTASSIKHGRFLGGVITSEEAWKRMIHLSNDCSSDRTPSHPFDTSSYEYSISLLCQALRCTDAEVRLDELKRTACSNHRVGNSAKKGDTHVGPAPCMATTVDTTMIDSTTNSSLLESLAVSYTSLARAYAKRGQRDEAIHHATTALAYIESATVAWRQREGNPGTTAASSTFLDVHGDDRVTSSKRMVVASGGTLLIRCSQRPTMYSVVLLFAYFVVVADVICMFVGIVTRGIDRMHRVSLNS